MHNLSFFRSFLRVRCALIMKLDPNFSWFIVNYCTLPPLFSIFLLTFHTGELIIKVRKRDSYFALL